jgi:hypothetical protein
MAAFSKLVGQSGIKARERIHYLLWSWMLEQSSLNEADKRRDPMTVSGKDGF